MNDEMKIKTEYGTMLESSFLEKIPESKSENEIDAFNVQVKKFDDFFRNINEEKHISFIKLDIEQHEYFALQGMKQTIKENSPIICFEQHEHQFDYFNKVLSSDVINFLKNNNYLYFYEVLYIRKWRFSKNNFANYTFVNKMLKVFEVILFGMPEASRYLTRINEFQRKFYQAIIASSKKL